ncbi:MAG: tRNA pseudouridine synthase B [Candidatus Izimaplasma bacterium HR2]|nr:MAG: tRNA pseudouridine synthase B [Candidatus Izimaplasma bacterium HR2]
MNGILLVDKPKDFTSHDVINVLRGVLKTKKLGHTGTLDPDATGVLVVGVNKGTKVMRYLNNDEKVYNARVCIGISTNTLDKTGEVVEKVEVSKLENVDEIIKSFLGTYTQTPPMYSAIKYKGKRLYEYARKGIVIDDIPSRDIEIFDIKRISDIIYEDGLAYFDYSVHSSKGLYVRTLSYDIGKLLGYPAHNYELRRLKAGKFTIEDSYTLDEIKKGDFKLITLNDALSDLETLVINDEFKHHVKNGMAISLRYFKKHTLTKIIDNDGTLLAIYDKHPSESKMRAINVYPKEVE